MGEVIHNQAEDNQLSSKTTYQSGEFLTFNSLASFSEAVEAVTGLGLDLESVVALNTDFVNASDQYLLLNVKEYNGAEPNNLLFVTEDKVYTFSKNNPSLKAVKAFQDVLQKPFGRSTVLCFLLLDKVLEKHKERLETISNTIRKLEAKFDHVEYRGLTVEFERFSDRLEEFDDLLLRLQERRFRQVETQYISFDYSVLIAESLSLQGRCRRRLDILKDLRQDHDMRATEELNERIVNLDDVVKKLTAITVILMVPTLIASHFGMNFAFMPELKVWWAYPLVIAVQLVAVAIGIGLFRKWKWL